MSSRASEIAPGVLDALADDLNTPAALSELHRLAHPAVMGRMLMGLSEMGQMPAPQLLKTSANLLGLLQQTQSERQATALSEAKIDAAQINAIVAERAQARAARNWAEIRPAARPSRRARRRHQGQ